LAGNRSVIDTLVVELTTDTSGFRSGLTKMQRSLEKTGKSMQRVGRRMTMAFTAVFAAIGAKSLQLAEEYEMAMNRVQAVTDSTQEQMQQLNDQAMYLGRTTARSARQIAGGMETLGLAGFSTEQIQDSIDAVTSLSVIAQQEMAISARDAANVMSQFQIEAKDLDSAVDSLAETATSSNQKIEDLVNGLRFAGPIANQAGISLEETAATMGILANNGIRAGIAGRALRMGILKLVAPTAGAKEKLRQLGVTIQDDAGNLLSLNNILENVNEGIEGMGVAERMASLRTIFGTRSLGPMNILLQEQQTILENGTNAFQNYANQIQNAEGRADKMRETLLQGLPGAFILFKSATEGLLLSLRELYESDVEAFLYKLIDIFNSFSDLRVGESVMLNMVRNFGEIQQRGKDMFSDLIGRADEFIESLIGIDNVLSGIGDKISEKFDQLVTYLEEAHGFILRGGTETVTREILDENGDPTGETEEVEKNRRTRGSVVDIALLAASTGPAMIALGIITSMLSKVVGLLGMVSGAVGTVVKSFMVLGSMKVVGALTLLTWAMYEFFDFDFTNLQDSIRGVYEWFMNLEEGNSVILTLIRDGNALQNVFENMMKRMSSYYYKLVDMFGGEDSFIHGFVQGSKEKLNELLDYIEDTFNVEIERSLTQGGLIDLAIIGAAIVPVTMAVTKLSVVFGLLKGSLAAVGSLFSWIGTKVMAAFAAKGGAVIATTTGIIAAISAVIYWGYELQKEFGEIVPALKSVWDDLVSRLGEVWDTLKSTGSSLKGLFVTLFDIMTKGSSGEAFSKLFSSLIKLGGTLIDTVLITIKITLLGINAVLDTLDVILQVVFGKTGGDVLGIFVKGLAYVLDGINWIIKGINWLYNGFEKLFSVFTTIIRGIPKAISAVVNGIKMAVWFVTSFIKSVYNIVGAFYQVIGVVAGFILELWKIVFGPLYDMIEEPLEKGLAGFKKFGALVVAVIAGMVTNLKVRFGQFKDNVMSVVNAVKEDFASMGEFFGNIIGGMYDSITGMVSRMGELLSAGIDTFKGFFTDLKDEWKRLLQVDMIKDLLDMFAGLAGSIINPIIDLINNQLIGRLNTISVDIMGKTFGFDIPQIGRIGEEEETDYDPNSSHPAYGQAAKGAYVKRKQGGSFFQVGEGGDDEVISPVPMLKKMLSDAMRQTQKRMLGIIQSGRLQSAAVRSLGTGTTPLNEEQKTNNVNIVNNNNFNIDGNIQEEVSEALRRTERDSRLRMRGVKI